MKKPLTILGLCGLSLAASFTTADLYASSHREAPNITRMPKLDSTDVYLFRSYEPGREDFVTIIGNYIPLQDPDGGPNYFSMDPNAVYEIHIDNDGDAHEDITFQFDFTNTLTNNGTGVTLNVGGQNVPIALKNIGPVTGEGDVNLGFVETYTVTHIAGDRRTGNRNSVTHASSGGTTFGKPYDNIGNKTFPDYNGYANQFIHPINVPGCSTPGKMFVGQRQEGFSVNLGQTFDLVNIVPIEGSIDQLPVNNSIADKNITSFALEIHSSCLTGTGNGVIGAWITSSLPQASIRKPGANTTFNEPESYGGALTQVSRLGMPLVNEVVIGLPDKDKFNASEPKDDAQFGQYVTNPTFPAILDALFRAAVGATTTIAPTNFPRNDLVATFLTGISGVNQQATVTASEMMRLNTGIAPTPRGSQSRLGVAGDDLAGYPNGRRPGDDVVDITLRVAMGILCHPVPVNGTATDLGLCAPADASTGTTAFTDGAPIADTDFGTAFPYLNTPVAGSPFN